MDSKYMWIHLQNNVESHEWARARNGSHQTIIDYEPELKNKKNSIDYDSACVFFHRKSKFIFELSSGKDSTHLGAHITYVPKNSSDVNNFIEDWNDKHSEGKCKYMHDCDPEEGWYREDNDLCRQYAWLFDHCVIKMNFTNQNKDKIFKKRLIMKCERSSKDSTMARFDDPMFISKEELKSNFNYDADSAKGHEFLPVVIEISSRIYLAGWTDDGERVKEEDKNLLITRPSTSQNLTASNKRMKLSSFAQSYQSTLRPDDENCNLVLEIGPDGKESISVHKALLAVKSPVFYTMYGGGWQDSNSGILKMKDSTLEQVTAFVNFLYDSNTNVGTLDRFDWDLKVFLGVLKLAHFYQVKDLIEFCVDNMIVAPDSDLSLTTALEIFISGQLFDIQDLSARSLHWIKSYKSAFTSDDKAKLDDFIASVDDKEKFVSSIE